MIQRPDGFLLQIQTVQFPNVAVEGIVGRHFQQVPVRFSALIPLPEHGKLIAHEVQLLAGMGHHVQVQKPCLGEFLLIASMELINDGFLAMHHLIVGEGQNVSLVVGVVNGKGDFMLASVYPLWDFECENERSYFN